MDIDSAHLEKLRLELRRGAVPLAVLASLRKEQHGYSLRKQLAQQGLDVAEGTLYPLIRRLESQGLLISEWRQEDARKKRFYQLSNIGEQVLTLLIEEWQQLNGAIEHIVEGH